MTRRATARLIPLEAAKQILGGHHPIMLGIGEALPGVFDVRAIHEALDRRAGLRVEVAGPGGAANDVEADELADLEKRINARAARRS